MQYILTLDILLCQITTFIKVRVAFVFRLQTLSIEAQKQKPNELLWMLWFDEKSISNKHISWVDELMSAISHSDRLICTLPLQQNSRGDCNHLLPNHYNNWQQQQHHNLNETCEEFHLHKKLYFLVKIETTCSSTE